LTAVAAAEVPKQDPMNTAVAMPPCNYPPNTASHSREQDFYFGPDFLLRRHDYHVEASGSFAAAQYVYGSVTVQGITLPIKGRAYMRDERLLPIHDRLMVSIDLSDVSFS
jgi:hypothetical protein